MDRVWQRVRQVPVTWVCPHCDSRQGFAAKAPSVERGKDFVPKKIEDRRLKMGGKEISTPHPNPSPRSSGGEGEGIGGVDLRSTAENGADRQVRPTVELQLLPAPPVAGSYAGLKVARSWNDLKSAEEIAALAKTAYLECYHCGAQLQDSREMRWALMQSYEQDYTGGRALSPGTEIGFWNPEVVSITIPFRDTMKEYIVAKKAHAETGNLTALETFYSSRWATAWDEKLAAQMRQRAQEAYDVEMARHDAWRLAMIIDNQKDLAQQWAMVLAVKKDASVRQLWRGPLLGLAACREKQLSFGVDAKGRPLLKDQFVFLDGQYMPEQICQHIVDHQYGHWGTFDGEKEWFCWNILQGSRYEYQTHAVEKDANKKFVVGDPRTKGFPLNGRWVEILVYPFSATACGQRFEMVRDGRGPEVKFLPPQPGEPPDDHASGLSHHAQIHSNKLVASKSVVPRDAREKYVPVPASAPDHYFHMWRMFEAVKEIWGIDGQGAVSPKPEVQSPKEGELVGREG